MSALFRLLMVAGSALLAWFIYLQWLYAYAKNLSWLPYLMALALFSMFLMFLRNIKRGEVGHLELFGSDMNTKVQQGWYWPPSIAPFLQGIDLTLGLDIVHERLSTLGSIGGNPNIYHHQDQNLSNLQFRANTDSLVKANFFHDLNRLKNWIFSIRDSEGRVRYYKVGAILYVLCWIFAFFGNIGNHASSAVNHVVSTVNAVVKDSTTAFGAPSGMVIRLNVGTLPIIPEQKGFIPRPEKEQLYAEIDGSDRVYVFFNIPTPPARAGHVFVNKPLCSMIPTGEKVLYWTSVPPTHALNVNEDVTYMRKKYGFTLGGWLDELLLEPASATWTHLRNHWTEAETTRNPILARAMEKDELASDQVGGLVCF